MPASHQAARYQEVKIRTATPTELVVMMYDSAIAGLQQARACIQDGEICGRARNLNKVSSILTELQATLNFQAGGEIAQSLDRLYAYMRNRLFQASLHQDGAAVEEVARLMASLRSAWVEVAQAEAARGQSTAAPTGSLPSTGSPVPAGAEVEKISGLSITA
jgi:flagellar protein FliS